MPSYLSTSGYSSTALSPLILDEGDDRDSGVVLRHRRDHSEPPVSYSEASESEPTPMCPPRSRNRVRRHVSITGHDRPFTFQNIINGFRRKSPSSQRVPTSKSAERIHSLDCLSEAELQSLLNSAREMHISSWRPCHVLAWVKLELQMDQYLHDFSENIKSGKSLVELTDQDIATALKISNPMLNKKLRLAIQEYLNPNDCEYTQLRNISASWVSDCWLPSLGMRQYANPFRECLVDGRVLHQLTAKQLGKYLGVTYRFHQLSILRGIELLRSFSYNLAAISERRSDSEQNGSDLLMWSNQRFYRWLSDISLDEYCSSLEVSGLHGALAALEPAFTGDGLANALNIPRSRTVVRKHLASEFSLLLQTARTDARSPTNALLFQRRRRPVKAMPRSKSAVLPGRFSSEGIRHSFQRVFSIRKNSGSSMVTSKSYEYWNEKRDQQTVSGAKDFHSAAERSPIGPLTLTSPKQTDRNSNTLNTHFDDVTYCSTQDGGSQCESDRRSLHLKTILERAPQVLASRSTYASPTGSYSNNAFRNGLSPTSISARGYVEGKDFEVLSWSKQGYQDQDSARNLHPGRVVLRETAIKSPTRANRDRPHSLAESSPSKHPKSLPNNFQDSETLPYCQQPPFMQSIENINNNSPSRGNMGVIAECELEAETDASCFLYKNVPAYRRSYVRPIYRVEDL